METTSPVERLLRGVALTLVVVFFMFPIVWIFLMSFQTNETILRIPHRWSSRRRSRIMRR